MDRKIQRTLLGAVAALFVANLTGIGYLEAGKTALGLFMIGGSAVGWIILVVRWPRS